MTIHHTKFRGTINSQNYLHVLVSIVSSQGPHEDQTPRWVLFHSELCRASSVSSDTDPWSPFALESSSGRAGLYHNVWLTTYAFITIFMNGLEGKVIYTLRGISVCQIYSGWWYNSCCGPHIIINQSGLNPSNMRGCQSNIHTWSTGQDNIRGASTKLQQEHESKTKQKNKRIVSLSSHLNVLIFFPLTGGCSEGL